MEQRAPTVLNASTEWKANTIELALDRGDISACLKHGGFEVWRTGPATYDGEANIGGSTCIMTAATFVQAVAQAKDWAAQCEE